MTQSDPQPPPRPRDKTALSDKLDAAGWGLSFVWVGVAALASAGWGWGLVGIAVIILGEAVLRWRLDLKVGRFWIGVGTIFLVGGLWELLSIPWPLVPVLIILCGVAILWGALSGSHVMRK